MKRRILILLMVFWGIFSGWLEIQEARAETQGPYIANTVVNQYTSPRVWTPEASLQAYTASSDNNRVMYTDDTMPRGYLKLTNFGFTIPTTGATINGIVVTREGYSASKAKAGALYHMGLTKDNNAIAGTEKIDLPLPYSTATTEDIVNVGTATDLWGTTWIAADINSVNFGVWICPDVDISALADMFFDHIQVTVTYTVAEDTTAPAAITNLSALTGDNAGEVKLTWSAPGDDGTTNTLNGEYAIQHSSYVVSWSTTAAQIVFSTSSVTPGSWQSRVVTGLTGGTTYYFRIWTADEVPNWSDISNGATTWAKISEDSTPPAAITNLSALTGDSGGEVKLNWSAPGDDEWDNPISGGKYGVKWSTYTPFDWNGPSSFDLEWATSTSPGTAESKVIGGLTGGVTYYFRIWTRDEVTANWSGISNGATTWAKVGVGDTTPPGPVTNLTAKAKAQIELTWTAPGDDDYTGTATEYIIRYSTVGAITNDTQWSQATDLEGEPTPLLAGTTQSMTVTGLRPGTTHYFAIKSKDEANNPSNLDTSSPEPAAKAGNLYLVQTIFSDTAGTEAKLCYFALGDYDNDGDLDLIYTGKGSGNAKLALYRNEGGLFNTTPVQELMSGDGNGLSSRPCVEFGDIDNDGDLDLAVMGVDDNGNSRLIIYRNDGGGAPFTKLQEPLGATGGLVWGNLAFADIDNDGDLDLAATGTDVSNNRRFIIFENNISSFTVKQQPLGTSALTNSCLVFGDLDQDGDQDIFITGWDGGGGTYAAYVYRNDGGNFTSIKNWDKSVVGTEKCHVALGDYDLDGDLDLAIAGESWPNIRFRLYKYVGGTDVFTADQNPLGTDADVGGLGMGSVAFGDYDNDGDIDIAAIGYGWYDQTNWYKITRFALFKNNNGTYNLDQEPMGIKIYKDTTTVQGMSMGRVTFGDIDNDGDLDVVVGGNMDPSNPVSSKQYMELRVYYNTEKDYNNNENSAPSAPASLTGLYDSGIVTLQWNPGGDPSESYSVDADMLYYNLRVGKVSEGDDVVSDAYGSPLLGNYLRPKISTTQLGVKLKNLETRCTYYWNVRTIDSGLKKSSWSSQQSVYVPAAPLTLYYRTDNCSSPFPTTSDKLSTSAGTSSDVTTTAQTNQTTVNYYQLRPGINTNTVGVTSLPSAITQYGWIYGVDQTGYVVQQGSWTFKVGYYCTNATMASNLYYRVCKVTATASNVYKVATLRDWASQSLSGSTSLTYTTFQTWVSSTTFNAGEYIMAEFYINPTAGGGGGAPTRYWYFEVGTSSNYITTQNIGDFTPPGAITNLSALSGDEDGRVNLSWTAPGDNGYAGDNSVAAKYILKYATYSVNGSPTTWWNGADIYGQNWTVAKQGTMENKTLVGLEPGTTYWFAIKTVDDNGNVSDIDTNATNAATQANAVAYLGPPTISKIVFITSPQTIPQGVVSSTMTIQTQTSGGTPVNVTSDTIVTLESSSSGGKFSLTSSFVVEVTSVTIANGTNSANFYYKDTVVGNPIIIANELDSYGYGWDPAQQQETITGTAPDLSVSSTTIVFSDDTPLPNEVITISATIKNDGGDYISGYTVIFTSQPSNNNLKTVLSDTVWIGQSFLTGSRKLLVNKVELYMQGQAAAGLTYVQIETDDNNKPSGTRVGGRTGFVAVTEAKQWYTFEFGTKPLLQPTTKYWIVAKNETSITSDLYHDTTAPYANGEEKKYSAGSWTSTNADTTFRLYVDYTVVQFYDGDPATSGTQIGADQNFTPIPSFSSTTASVNWTAVTGDHDIYVTVDLKTASPGDISESDETNNKAFRTIHVDSSPPAGITNLSALTGDNEGEIKLSWSAPGDDGWNNPISGGKYGVKYATYSAFDFTGPSGFNLEWSTNTTSGASESKVVTGLTAGTTYYFRIWTADEVFNWSSISNGATTWAQVSGDTTSPAAITNLSALTGDSGGEVKLSWSAPGDDGWDNPISGGKYGVKYATYSAFDFTGPSGFNLEWSTSTTSGASESKVVNSLTPGTTYYFRIWTRDEVTANWSGISNGATTWAQVDVIAPAAITDLTGFCDSDTGEVTLSWSTPGDDGWNNTLPSGSEYRIDYSSYSIQWSTASYKVFISTSGVAPHIQVSHIITGLTGDTTWYFQIWTRDEVPTNWSGLSNGATIWVNPILSVSISTDTYDFGEVPMGVSTHTVSVITVTNEGNVNETYSLKISSVTLYDNSPSLWKSTNTTTGHNRFIFYAIFHGTDVASGYFELTDAVVDENRSSTSERYTYQGGSPPYKQTGLGVPAGEDRKIWFRLDMPTSTTTGKEEKITVTITAGPE